jgi:MFS transporter, OPA family, sugar phosphate sensor protein UhpC
MAAAKRLVGREAIVTFALIYAAYAVAYLNKRNLRYNVLLENGIAGPEELGFFGSSFETAQGPAKILSGLVVDALSPTWVLVAATAGAGVVNIAFTRAPGLAARVGLWGVNGVLQAFSWPALSTIFMNYFKDSPQRGTLYAILSTSQNAGAAFTPAFVSLCMSYWGWQASFWVPGGIALVCAAAIALLVRDRPTGGDKAVGLPSPSPAARIVPPPSSTSPGARLWQIVGPVVSSRAMWALGVSYAFNSLVRSALIDWAPVVLQVAVAASSSPAVIVTCVTAYELGGAAGGLLSGVVSDALFQGRRAPVMIVSSAALAALLTVLAAAFSPGSAVEGIVRAHATILLTGLYAAVGFLAFAPHVLNGLMTRELAPDGAGATAAGFSKSVGQVGAACAGYPVGLAAVRFGWPLVILALALAALLSCLSVVHLWASETKPAAVPAAAAAATRPKQA